MLSLLLRKDSKIVENQDKQQDDIKQIASQFTFPVRDEMLYFFRGLHGTPHGLALTINCKFMDHFGGSSMRTMWKFLWLMIKKKPEARKGPFMTKWMGQLIYN